MSNTLLIVYATYLEAQPLLLLLQPFLETSAECDKNDSQLLLTTKDSTFLSFVLSSKLKVQLLITGAGLTATSCWVTKITSLFNYSLAINAGIAGCFDSKLSIGSVVYVTTDTIADMGSEEPLIGFKPISQMPFFNANAFPYQQGYIYQNPPQHNTILQTHLSQLPQASGITVNCVTGKKTTLRQRRQLFNPDIETMEGAAFFYACHLTQTPCIAIRAISNRAGDRKYTNWDLPLAVEKLTHNIWSLIKLFQ